MIHLEGRLVSQHRGNLTNHAIEQHAIQRAGVLYGTLPDAVIHMAATIPDCLEKTERCGDLIIEDTTGRLIAEAMDCTPADIGRNPPELPDHYAATRVQLRAKQQRRLVLLVRGHRSTARAVKARNARYAHTSQ